MMIGTPGGAAEPECCYQPNDVIVAKNGDIFVADGHGTDKDIIFKFDKNGKPIKHWRKHGTAPREFSFIRLLSIPRAGCMWPIVTTIAFRFSTKMQLHFRVAPVGQTERNPH